MVELHRSLPRALVGSESGCDRLQSRAYLCRMIAWTGASGSSACDNLRPRRTGSEVCRYWVPSDSRYAPVDSGEYSAPGTRAPGAVSAGCSSGKNPYFRRLCRGAPEHAGSFRCTRTWRARTPVNGRPNNHNEEGPHARARLRPPTAVRNDPHSPPSAEPTPADECRCRAARPVRGIRAAPGARAHRRSADPPRHRGADVGELTI